jgi:hypothetical protein
MKAAGGRDALGPGRGSVTLDIKMAKTFLIGKAFYRIGGKSLRKAKTLRDKPRVAEITARGAAARRAATGQDRRRLACVLGEGRRRGPVLGLGRDGLVGWPGGRVLREAGLRFPVHGRPLV